MRLAFARSSALALVLAAAAGPGLAQPSPPSAPAPTQISAHDAAVLLIRAGKLDDAAKVLTALERADPKDSETAFLLGMIDVQQKRYASAISRFRRILVREPGAVRVRLELARAFYLKRDYDNAERQFRFARAGDLPATVKGNIDRYLYAIRLARQWSYNFALALAPDTNLNAGPGVSAVEVYGLPFQLSSNARQQSGVGVTLDAGGEWSPALTPHVRLRVGGQIDTTDYRQGEFDDTTVAAYAGPRFVTSHWDISPLATGFHRWYGGRFYNEGVGGSVQAIDYATAKTGFSASVGAQSITYAAPASQSGPAYTASLGYFRVPSPLSIYSGSLTVTRQQAGLAAYSNTAGQLQLGYYRDLPRGFSISLQPSIVWIRYDAPLAAFGVARADHQWTMQLAVLNRRVDIAGFTPRLTYAYTRNASNIPLYSYDRNRFEIGLTRTF